MYKRQEEELAGQEVLSSREKEIITCVVKGMTNKEIADALYLSAHTVITHRRNIARKLPVSYTHLIAYHDRIAPTFDEIRAHIANLELIVDNEMWTLPKYREILFLS